MNASIGRARQFSLTKRNLGEGYIAGVSTVLASVAVGVLVVERPVPLFWALGVLTVVVPAALVYWLHRLDLETEQVWYVAECAAFGTGFATVALVGLQVTVGMLAISAELTVVLTAVVATTMAGGTLVGVVRELRRSNERLALRNQILHRVLRHNLRNDVTVVLGHLEDVRSSVDGPEREKLATAERKLDALVDLTDKARQVNVAMQDGSPPTRPLDLAALVEDRVAHLREVHAALDITVTTPDAAWVYAEPQFGLVVDNVVESAIVHSTAEPGLTIECVVKGDEVRLRIEDDGGTIPDNDLSAVAAGTEDALDHGYGVELWLVYWLTERTGGSVTVDTDGERRHIEMTLRRAAPIDRGHAGTD